MRWRSILLGTLVSTVAALPARAQEDEGPMAFARRFQERALERQAERLGLVGEQKERFLTLHREFQQKLEAAEQARDAAVKDLLTPEQREKLAEQERNPFGHFGGPQVRFGGPGAGDRMAIESAAGLAKKLGLDDAQRATLDAIYADYEKEQAKAAGDLDLSDPAKLMEQAPEIAKQHAAARKARDERIRAVLTERQRAAFEKLAKESAGPVTRSIGLAIGPDGPVVLGGGEDGGDPAKALEEAGDLLKGLLGGDGKGGADAGGLLGGLSDLMGGQGGKRLKDELKLSEEEALVLWPLVEKIQKLEREHQAWRRSRHRELRRALRDEGTSVAEQLTALRERETAHRRELAAVRDELRSLVTVRQEAVLVGHGVLD